MQDYVIGVDLGGTNVRAAGFSASGRRLCRKFHRPSQSQDGPVGTFGAVTRVVKEVRDALGRDPLAVGLAIPGHVDDAGGRVVWAPNFTEVVDGERRIWENVMVRDPLERATGLRFFMGNDANLAALGEYRFGVGETRAKCLVLLTLGTGVGGGVILRPEAVQGQATGPMMLLGGNKGGVELGHIIVSINGLDSNAGNYGGLEGYCRRDAIVNRAVHRLRRGRESLLTERCGRNFSKVTPRMLSEAAEAGDVLAIEVWEEIGATLGAGIGSLISVFAPDVFAVGGQIAQAGEFLLGPARRAARDTAVPTLFQDCTILQAKHGDEAGIQGAAAQALHSLGIHE